MNKGIKRIVFSLAAMALALCAVAQSSDAVLRDKVTDAVMKVYDDHLAQNPNDYNILFARAHQQYYNGDFTAALADVNQAMLLTPNTDKELRFDEHILRARISDARKDYASELADLRLAQELQPKSLACTDMIAKANLKAGNLDAAEKAFKKILRSESMNYDAMYGIAQILQMRGNEKAALEQMDKAVALFRTEPQVYVNRANIKARQGDIEAAVQDLLSGMAVGNGGNAAQALFDLSDTNYDAVMSTLARLADLPANAENSGMYRYLRANIAMDHTRYAQALSDLKLIKRNHLYYTPSVDYSMAKCCLELARWEEAMTSVEQALAADPSRPEFYIVKALAAYQQDGEGNVDNAMDALNACARIAPHYVPMLLTKAQLYLQQGQENEALGYLNAAVANDPTDGDALLQRGLLLKKLDNLKLATRDFNTVAMMGDNMYDLKGIALTEVGRDSEAFRWLDKMTSASQPGGENFYNAAVFMALRGDNYKAMDYLQKAITNGFGSLYKLRYDQLTPFNLSSLYDNPDYDLAVDKAQRNFVVSD
jgi:tetratricopeptide (TPR) repeat protein